MPAQSVPPGRASEATGGRVWTRDCHVHGRPTRGSESGDGVSLDDCKAKFRAAWEASGPGSLRPISSGRTGYAEVSREALARYDRRANV